MSGGGGNNRQMPMASNRGQQQMGMQPQMGMAPQSGMLGQPQLNQQQQQAFDQMRQSNFLAPQRPEGPYETPQPMPKMGGGQQMTGFNGVALPEFMRNQQSLGPMGQPQGGGFSDTYGGAPVDQARMQAALRFAQQAQTGNMDPMGGMPMQTNQPYAMPGQPMGGGQQVFGSQGIRDLFRDQYAQNQMNPNQVPYGSAAGQIGMGNMPSNLPGRGMPSGFRPSMGAIDGRALTDKLDITKRRQMNELPGSIQNTLPPSLKRPTQARMGLAGSIFGGKP